MSRMERAGIRWGVVWGFGLLAYVRAKGGVAAADGLILGTLIVVGGLTLLAKRKRIRQWRHRKHYRNWIQPLHYALSTCFGYDVNARPDYIRVPPNFHETDGSGISIGLPLTWTGENRATVASLIVEKLGLPAGTVRFEMAGRQPIARVTLPLAVPDRAAYSEVNVRQHLAEATESAPLLGFTRGAATVAVDLDAESPHVLISAGSGGGKSVIMRAVLSQALRHGAVAAICDFKRHSHKWARKLDSVGYFRDIGEIHDALIELAAEGQRRNRIVDDWDDDSTEPDVGPRLYVALEEMNATIRQLQKHWNDIRESKDPKTSPAVDALGELLFMGRAVKIHVIAVAQMATARSIGGPEMRENFATRILARYSANAWKMLAPEVPYRVSRRHAGRAQVIIGGEARETQIVFLTEAEAYAWAAGGPPLSYRTVMDVSRSHVAASSHPGSSVGTTVSADDDADATVRVDVRHLRVVRNVDDEVTRDVGPDVEMTRDVDAPITLSEACHTVLSGLAGPNPASPKSQFERDLMAARAASQRDPEFPDSAGKRGQAKLYRPSHLRIWRANRPRAASGE